jgi:hypothetical protein
MACDNLQVWRPNPAGNKFVISAKGDENLFNIVVGVNRNGVPETIWRHEVIVPGPKTRTINDNDRCVFNVLLVVFSDPKDPITLDAHIADVNDKPDPDRSCSWSFLHAGQFVITIFASNK